MRDFAKLGVLALTALPTVAHANLFDLYGAGSRDQSMGGALTAVTQDAYATYINPAGLADAPRSLSAGITGAFNRTSIKLMPRPQGYDSLTYPKLKPRTNTEDNDSVLGFGVGLSIPLFLKGLTLGGLVYIPYSGFANASTTFADEREQYFSNKLDFSITGDRVDSEVLAFGLGYRVTDWLALGIGLSVLFQNSTNAQVYSRNAADLSDVDLNIAIEQSVRRALNAGLIITPKDWLHIGLDFRDEIYFQIGGDYLVTLNGQEEDEPTAMPLAAIEHYIPPQLSLAVAANVTNQLLLSLEGTMRGWSRYKGNHGEDAGFKDTFEIAFGGEYKIEEGSVRAGLGYAPSPVPNQTGRTNYVDNDRLFFSTGAGRRFELFEQDLGIDFSLQIHMLSKRTTHKKLSSPAKVCGEGVNEVCDEVPDISQDTPLLQAADTAGLQTGNPGFPGFTSGGYILAASIELSWRF